MTAIWQNDGTGWRLLAPVGLGAPEPVTKATGPEPVRARSRRELFSSSSNALKAMIARARTR